MVLSQEDGLQAFNACVVSGNRIYVDSVPGNGLPFAFRIN